MDFTPTQPAPPQWQKNTCGVGFDETAGCRLCVNSCPYEAIQVIGAVDGLKIHIDSGNCQSCGACSSVCPSSAIKRSFLLDEDIDAMVTESLKSHSGNSLVVFLHRTNSEKHRSAADQLPVVFIELPSLLILNETHLLQALDAGACGVVIVGCTAGHHGAPHLFEYPLLLAQNVLGAEGAHRVSYLEDDGNIDIAANLQALFQSLQRSRAMTNPVVQPDMNHRARFASLAAKNLSIAKTPSVEPAARLQDVPFAEVAVLQSGCTLCGACSRVCPTEALEVSKEGQLKFRGIDCIGCGLCEQACPEQGLTMIPGLALTQETYEPKILIEDQVLR